MAENPPIVLGGGMAGLLAAAALRRRYDRVVVLERDVTLDSRRRGVPQGDQLHNLLGRAQLHIERLLPGYLEDLLASGGQAARVADQTHVNELGVVMPKRDLGLRLVSAPRPLLEEVARRRLADLGGVEIDRGAKVECIDTVDGRIRRVLATRKEGRRLFDAEIVVDAMGAGSPMPTWLAPTIGRVPVIEQRTDHWYVTTRFRRPAAMDGDPRFWLVFPSGDSTRGTLVSPLDDQHWNVSVSGRSADRRPATAEQVGDFVKSIHDPEVRQLLDGAVPSTAPFTYRKMTATWRRYDQLRDPLTGLLPIGDAVAAVNPIFGQGISVAAWQADVALSAVITEPSRLPQEQTERYLVEAGRIAERAWSLSAAMERVTGSGHRHQRAIANRLLADPEAHDAYVRAWHLLVHPEAVQSALDRPAVSR